MAFCPKCGKQVENNENFCTACGAAINQEEKNNATSEPIDFSVPPTRPKVLNTTQLVWSIINLVLCCMPLGIAALVCTIMAKDAVDVLAEQKYLKTAKTCNIISTIVGAIVFVLSFIYGLIMGLASAGLM